MFFGTVPEAIRHFTEIGHTPPPGQVPTDFFLQASSSHLANSLLMCQDVDCCSAVRSVNRWAGQLNQLIAQSTTEGRGGGIFVCLESGKKKAIGKRENTCFCFSYVGKEGDRVPGRGDGIVLTSFMAAVGRHLNVLEPGKKTLFADVRPPCTHSADGILDGSPAHVRAYVVVFGRGCIYTTFIFLTPTFHQPYPSKTNVTGDGRFVLPNDSRRDQLHASLRHLRHLHQHCSGKTFG